MSARLHSLLSDHLDKIAALYKVRPRITLIVRIPGAPDQGTFLSDDSWADAVAAVEYLQGNAAYVAGPPEPQPEPGSAYNLPRLAMARRNVAEGRKP